MPILTKTCARSTFPSRFYTGLSFPTNIELRDAPRYVGRKAARKIEEQTPPFDDDDDDELSSSSAKSSDSDDEWESIPESNKESELGEPDPADSSDSSVEIIDQRPFQPPVIEIPDDSPPASPVLTPTAAVPLQELTNAIEGLTLSVTCMQELHRLPFLRRNLRRGFLNYCRARGLRTELDCEVPSVAVVFKLADSELPPHEASVTSYECPLCQLHFPFQTKQMLETHLDRDHVEVRTSWQEIRNVSLSLLMIHSCSFHLGKMEA
jgi:hypothetical protein